MDKFSTISDSGFQKYIDQKLEKAISSGQEMQNIYVTKTFLPPIEEYLLWISKIYQTNIVTNQGPLLLELESKIKKYLNVENFHYLNNGTIALQLALASLGITEGEIITTPFSYVATVSSILWERCQPVFADIEPEHFTIDPDKLEAIITPKTKAIMAVHVFGYPCKIEKIHSIAKKHGLKVIYDGAHAFGSVYNEKSLLSYGDITTVSFHATKLFHTIEGGGCVVNDKEASERMEYQKRFGHHYDEHKMLGINAKASEFHAAMGMAVYPYIDKIIDERKAISEQYDSDLRNIVERPVAQAGLKYNYAYYPVLFKSETDLLSVFSKLNSANIFPRRYFYPSLNQLPYLAGLTCPISEDISKRIACLPLYVGLPLDEVKRICSIIKSALSK